MTFPPRATAASYAPRKNSANSPIRRMRRWSVLIKGRYPGRKTRQCRRKLSRRTRAYPQSAAWLARVVLGVAPRAAPLTLRRSDGSWRFEASGPMGSVFDAAAILSLKQADAKKPPNGRPILPIKTAYYLVAGGGFVQLNRRRPSG